MSALLLLAAFAFGYWFSTRVFRFSIRHVPDSNFEDIITKLRNSRANTWKTKKS